MTEKQTNNAPATQPASQTQSKELAMLKKDTADIVAARVRQFQETGEINLPENYSVENAMKSAWLILQGVQDRNFKPALEVCTKDSIANSLLDMVVQGLNPAKKQGYFIVYGNKLAFQRSYFGTMAVAMQVDETIAEIVPEVVYDNDVFKYKINRGKKEIAVHEQALENINGGKIKAAYALIINRDGEIAKTEIMNFDQIKQAWAQSQMKPVDEKGNIKVGSTHEKFTAEMAMKTVINRLCKPIINASNDSYLFRKAVNRSSEISTDDEVDKEIASNANSEVITDAEIVPDDPQTKTDAKDGANTTPATEGAAQTKAAPQEGNQPVKRACGF